MKPLWVWCHWQKKPFVNPYVPKRDFEHLRPRITEWERRQIFEREVEGYEAQMQFQMEAEGWTEAYYRRRVWRLNQVVKFARWWRGF